MTKTVALQKCDSYSEDIVYQSVKKLVELVPPPDVHDKVVLLKPNILYPKHSETAVCTHPVVVGAAVKVFYELGAKKVLVGESPAISNSLNAAKFIGMYEQVVKFGGEWADFRQSVQIDCPEGKSLKQLNFASQFTQADVVVSLAKLKSHQLMSYTGAMKNLFGLIVGLEKAQFHYRFSDKKEFGAFLTDIVIAAKPGYAIMDAVVGMDGPGGPGNGNPINLGFMAASDNILALDAKCSSLVGYNPHEIINLEDALERGIWLNSFDEIVTVGEPEENCRNQNFKIVKDPVATIGKMLPKSLDVLAKAFFQKTPHFSASKCKKCKKCEEICPVKIIKMNGKYGTAKLADAKKCLRCFCCHEICPFNAIKIKRF